jgi:hypothetical protein
MNLFVNNNAPMHRQVYHHDLQEAHEVQGAKFHNHVHAPKKSEYAVMPRFAPTPYQTTNPQTDLIEFT